VRRFSSYGRIVSVPVLVSGLILVALGVFAAAAIDREIRKGLESELHRLEGSFENWSGFTLRYDSLSPSILSGLVAKNLILGSPDGSRVLSARKVALRFDLGSLIGGGNPFISSILLEGADATFRSVDIDKVLALLRPGGALGSGSPRLPRIRIEARDIKIALPDLKGSRIAIWARHVDLDSRKQIPSLSIDGSAEGELPGVGGFSAALDASGSFSTSLEAARLRVKVSGKTADFSLSRQDFDLSLGLGIVELRKVRDSSPVDLYARYDLGSGDLTANLRSDAFRPESLFSPTGRLAFLAPWFKEAWSTSFDFSLKNFDLGTLRYDGRISGTLAKELIGSTWDVSLDASGDSRAMDIREAMASSEEGIFRFSGKVDLPKRLVEGQLDAAARLLGGRLPVKASLAIEGSSGNYHIRGQGIEIAGLDFGSAALDLGVDERGASSSFRLSLGLPSPLFDSGFAPEPKRKGLTVEGNLLLGANPLIECVLSFGVLDAKAVAPLIGAFLDRNTATMLESFALSGDLVFRSDLSHFSWSTSDVALRSRLVPGLEVDLSASGSDLDFRLRSSTLTYGAYSAQLAGDLSVVGDESYSFAAAFQYAGVPYNLKGAWIRGNLNVAGDYGLVSSARLTEDGIVGSLALNSLPFPLAGFPLSVSANANFRYRAIDDWSLALAHISVIPSSLSGALPGLNASGSFGPKGGTIVAARLFDRISSVSGSGSASWGGGATKLDLKFGDSSTEHYQLDASLGQDSIAADLTFGATPLTRFVQKRLAGTLDGSLHASGPIAAPSLTFDVSVRQGKFDDAPIDLHLAGMLQNDAYRIDDGLVQWQGFRISSFKANFDNQTGRGAVSGHFASSLILAGSSFDFASDLSSRVTTSSGPLDAFKDLLLTGSTSNFKYSSIATATWPFVVDISQRGVSIKGGPGGDFVLSLASDGSFSARAKAPFPILVTAQGRIIGDKIDAEAHGLSIEMPMLVALVGSLPVQFKGGRLAGDLVISGPVADPEFSGALQLANCELSMPGWINETAGPVTAPVVVDGKRFFLQAPSVPILNSHFGLDFELDFEGWVPTEVRVGLKSLPGTRVPIETNILGVAIKGFAVPDINLSLVGPILSVKGTLVLLDTDVIVTPQTLAPAASSDEAPVNLLDIDLGIETGRGVHFYFPDRNYPVIAGNVVPGNHLAIRYDQAKDDLSFKGTISARGGDAFYIQRNFFLRSASIVFNESSGKSFDPLVSMLAELRDSTADGPITVTLRADNQPISIFKPSITSDPAKSEADIALILGQGLLPLDESGGLAQNLGRIAIAGSEFVPQLNVTKAFESRVRDALNLDVLYFNSQAIQRWLFSLAGTGNQGLSTLSDYLKETNLFAGKYLSDSVFLHASARLDADPLVGSSNIGVVSEFGVDFETPFGLLQWTFQPAHPGQLFVNDQSLSLSWRLPLK